MCKLRTLVLFAIVICRTEAVLHENESYRVVFVNVIHRHGDRTPEYFYPNDPYQNASYWPEAIGQLTNLGKRQVFELGQWLHQRYRNLLTDHYNVDLIYARSTDKDRTLMSAECLLAGMFPPEGVQKWSDDIAWQPIPVHTIPIHMDKVLAQIPRTPCPAYEEELHRIFTTDEKIKQLNETYSYLFQWTNNNTGENYNLLTLYNIYDTLFVESLYNLSLPAWAAKVFPEPMRSANVYNYMLETWNPKLTRLMNGLLVQELIQNMADKMHNKTTRNLHVYTAHDETILNLLSTLGAFNHILPPYASCVMMELLQDSVGSYFVTLYYRNSTTDGPYQLTVGGCSSPCPMDQFINITRPVIPQDWDKECEVGSSDCSQYRWPNYVLWHAVLILHYCLLV